MVMQMSEKERQKMMKYGSVLKFTKVTGGGGHGLIYGGIVVFVFGAFTGILFGVMGMSHATLPIIKFAAVPAGIMIVIGALLRNKRISQYLSFYQKESGFSENELKQVDHELAALDVHMTAYLGENKKPLGIASFITENYVLINNSYLRRQEDLIAVAYTEEMPWMGKVRYGLLCLSKQDDDVYFVTFPTPTECKRELCTEIVQALYERNPAMIPVQKFEYNGKKYDLMKDHQEIRQMYLDGHRFIAE